MFSDVVRWVWRFENCAEYGQVVQPHCLHLRSVEFASAGGSVLLPVVMDFTPVPPGTLPAQALTLRGPDPDLVLAANDSFVATLGGADALNATNGPLANQRLMSWSDVAGELVAALFTADQVVLNSLVCSRSREGTSQWLGRQMIPT